MIVYDQYSNTFYDSEKKQNVITSDKTQPITLGDGLPWYYKSFIDILRYVESQNHIISKQIWQKARRKTNDYNRAIYCNDTFRICNRET